MKHLVIVLLVLLLSAALTAQQPDGYTFRVYTSGSAVPLTTYNFAAGTTLCNQPVSTSTVTVNPTQIRWTDINNVGRECVWIDSGTGPLFALPVPGTYDGTLQASNTAGSSSESARAPFARSVVLVPPVVPSNVRVLR